MKIPKAELAQKIGKLKSVVPKKGSYKALKGILVKDGYLIANNMEMAVKTKIGGAEGETFLIPEKAFDLIGSLPDGEIEIRSGKNHTITIQANKIKNKYQTTDPAEFLMAEVQEDKNQLNVKAELLLNSMKRVSYAVASQGANQTMTSMCLEAAGGKLHFAGLDGHVLAWDQVDYDGEFRLLIPKDTVDKLKSIGLLGEVQIRHNQSGAVFLTEDFELYTRLVEGEYFKYRTLFKELPLHTAVSRIELLDAMTRAKTCTEEKCPVRFELTGNLLHLSIKDSTTDYEETIELQEEMAENLTIGFNARLVLETLKAFDCETVRISLENPKMPMIVEAEDSDFKALVLPVTMH